MYQPPHFIETDLPTLHDLIDEVGVGLLVTAGLSGPVANLLPFRLDRREGKGVLSAHLARGNGQIADLQRGAQTLVVFQAASTYITPSFYQTKRETGKVVPTWNYVMVQARGTPVVMDSPEWLHRQIRDLTNHHEGSLAQPWSVEDAPDDFIASQVKGIIGVEIVLESLDGKWKASQNRTAADRAGVVAGLEARSDDASRDMARLVAAKMPSKD